MTIKPVTRPRLPQVPQPQSPAGFTEHDLAVRVSDVDFEDVYMAERAKLARYLMTQGADQYEAAEAVQAAFTRAWKNWDRIENPRAWLYKAALGEYFRANVRVREREVPFSSEDRDPAEPLNSCDIAMLNEQEQAMQAAVAVLPAKQRRVMALTIAGFTSAEIAEQLDCDPAAVRQNLRRARCNLAKHLGLTRRYL